MSAEPMTSGAQGAVALSAYSYRTSITWKIEQRNEDRKHSKRLKRDARLVSENSVSRDFGSGVLNSNRPSRTLTGCHKGDVGNRCHQACQRCQVETEM